MRQGSGCGETLRLRHTTTHTHAHIRGLGYICCWLKWVRAWRKTSRAPAESWKNAPRYFIRPLCKILAITCLENSLRCWPHASHTLSPLGTGFYLRRFLLNPHFSANSWLNNDYSLEQAVEWCGLNSKECLLPLQVRQNMSFCLQGYRVKTLLILMLYTNKFF